MEPHKKKKELRWSYADDSETIIPPSSKMKNKINKLAHTNLDLGRRRDLK